MLSCFPQIQKEFPCKGFGPQGRHGESAPGIDNHGHQIIDSRNIGYGRAQQSQLFFLFNGILDACAQHGILIDPRRPVHISCRTEPAGVSTPPAQFQQNLISKLGFGRDDGRDRPAVS